MIYDIIIIGGCINGILLEQTSKIISILSNNIYNDLILAPDKYKLHMKNNKVYVKYIQKYFIKRTIIQDTSEILNRISKKLQLNLI